MCPLRCESAIIEIFEMFHALADFLKPARRSFESHLLPDFGRFFSFSGWF